LVTRVTPYSVHLLFYRRLLRDDRVAQFPTYLRRSIMPERIKRLAVERGFHVRHFRLYEGPVQLELRKRLRVADWFFTVTGAISRGLSGGRVDLNLTDCVMVLYRSDT